MVRYSANGNSFVIFDILNQSIGDKEKNKLVLENIKDEDGALFVEKKDGIFSMDYFNRDGKRAKFCGNGSRAFLKYLFDSGYIKEGITEFWSHAGMIKGFVSESKVSVRMPEVSSKERIVVENYEGYLITIGVPHFVILEKNTMDIDVENVGRILRKATNANVDFFEELSKGVLKMRTYERGVERETKACGTGAAAVFVVYNEKTGIDEVTIHTLGGPLKLYLSEGRIFLEGSVEKCSEG